MVQGQRGQPARHLRADHLIATSSFEVVAIGRVESPLTDPALAPKQGDERAPDAFHPVEILSVEGIRVGVSNLEALDGTPVIDLKPVLDPAVGRR